MRLQKVLIIAGFLITWTCITYYFLLRNEADNSLIPKSNVAHMLHQLEQRALQEDDKSNKLLHKFQQVLMHKFKLKGFNLTLNEPRKGMPLPKPPADVEVQKQLDTSTSTTAKYAFTGKAKTHLTNGEPIIPVLVFACNRVLITKCLDNLLEYRPNQEQFPIIVSQDCADEPTKKVILNYGKQLTLIEQPDQSDIFVLPKDRKFKGYYKIARHYGWALNATFERGYDFVIIVEDDLNVAPDFFSYFSATYTLLKQDSTLWCISAWNDNGKENFVDTNHPELLYRTDFFPGLGWMLTKELWAELSVKWPKSFWDDWIRHPMQRKNRACIRPEISRTKTFGKIGVSNGLFFDKYLKPMLLSTEFVDFNKMNLSYLLKDNYDKKFLDEVYALPIVTFDELRRNLVIKGGPVRITYNNKAQYKLTTKQLGLMDDFKSGVPRTAYYGIVTFFYKTRRVYFAPSANWKGYDITWS